MISQRSVPVLAYLAMSSVGCVGRRGSTREETPVIPAWRACVDMLGLARRAVPLGEVAGALILCCSLSAAARCVVWLALRAVPACLSDFPAFTCQGAGPDAPPLQYV